VRAGHSLLDLARSSGARSLFVVGTGKNVGKTVTMRAVYEAACDAGLRVGIMSIGRDGEAVDASDAMAKPRLWLRSGTFLATARNVLPRSPACAVLELSPLQSAAGTIVYVRTGQPAFYELVGPPTASGVREAAGVLSRYAEFVIVDGAVDRVAALAGSGEADNAIVVAAGASAAPTIDEAAGAIGALVARLRVPRYDDTEESVRIEGALTPALASRLIAQRETRQVVVRDPTQIALTGKAAAQALSRLRLRCERPLRVVAATVASIGRERAFEPREFRRAVFAATGLPTFDVYAGERT
jgi:uncharacterized NAD-dependent epimerase/dehydratase family protein